MSAHFTKLRGRKNSKGQDAWGVQVLGGDGHGSGDAVEVTKKGGETTTVKVGELVARVYAIIEEEKEGDAPF